MPSDLPPVEEKFHAVYSDGKTAGSQKLLVGFGRLELELFDGQGRLFDQWPYELITSIEPLHPGEPTQIGHKEYAGARLFVEDSRFAEEMIAHLPHLSRKAATRRVVLPLAIIGGLLACIIGGIWVAGYSVPQAIAHMIPKSTRKAMGRQVVRSLSEGRGACHTPEGDKAFGKLLARLGVGKNQKEHYHVEIRPLGMMNAFAAPGEQIVVSKELLGFVKSPEELAGVIAHEMGHAMSMHPEAGIVRSIGISVGIAVAFGNTGGIGDVGSMLLQLKYTRSAEAEADRLALERLKRAQISPKPFASFFVRLEKQHGSLEETRARKDQKRQEADHRKKTGEDRKRQGEKGRPAQKAADKGNGTKQRLASYRRWRRAMQLLRTHPSGPERIKVITHQPKWKTRPLLDRDEWQALRKICSPK